MSLWLGTQEKVSVIRIVLTTVHIKRSRKLHPRLLKGWLFLGFLTFLLLFTIDCFVATNTYRPIEICIDLNKLQCLQLARIVIIKLGNSVQTGLTIYVSLWLATQAKVSVIRIVLTTVHIKRSRKLHPGLLKGWLFFRFLNFPFVVSSTDFVAINTYKPIEISIYLNKLQCLQLARDCDSGLKKKCPSSGSINHCPYKRSRKARFKRRATAVPNSIDRIKFDLSTAVARRLKPSRATAVPNSIYKLYITIY